MFGTFVKAGVGALGVYGIALILEKFLGEVLSIMANAPNAKSSMIYNAVSTAQNQFLLLGLVGIGTVLLVRAHVESKIGGGR